MLQSNGPRKPFLRVPSFGLRTRPNWAMTGPSIVQPESPSPRPVHPLAAYRWPLAIVILAVLALFAFLAFLWVGKRAYDETLSGGGRAADYALRKAEAVAEKFMRGNITKTFIAAIPEIASTGAGNLELATSDQTETFRAEDEKSILWDKLYLGRTISEIRVPATYRYHLRLADPWRLDVNGQTCIVIAPIVRPSLPPAIHTERMEKKSEAGWGRFNAREQMTGLEKSMTPTLESYAADPRHLALVRDQCRLTVAEFVKNWLLKEDQWRSDRFHTIKVLFADETNAVPDRVEPTLELPK